MTKKLAVHPDIVYPKITVPVELDQRNVWLLRALEDDVNRRAESGLIYEDDIDSQYVYTNFVGNGQRIAPLDLVLLRDNDLLLGAAVVQEIEKDENYSFERFRCPRCRNAKLTWRKNTKDWRCDGRCSSLPPSDRSTRTPVREQVLGVRYVARYVDTWSDLAGSMLASELQTLCDPGKWNAQNSIVQLNPQKVLNFFEHLNVSTRQQLESAGSLRVSKGGFVERTVKARLGQTQFRGHLIGRFGANCAFTGPCYLAALDAAHLYSYARVGEHTEGGGLLLRKDLHRLFDIGMVGVTPEQKIALHQDLADTQYNPLQGQPLKVSLGATEKKYLAGHFEMCRDSLISG